MISFPAKPVVSAISLPFDFISLLPLDVGIESAVITATVESGEDSNIQLLNGEGTVSGTVVSVPVHDGVPGVIYRISVAALGDDDNTYVLEGVLAVL